MTARSSGWLTVLFLLACGPPSVPPATPETSTEAARIEVPESQPPAPEPAAPISSSCTAWSETVELARLSDPRLGEISGLVASRAHPGILWVHNDSGEPYARFFAIDTAGVVRAEVVIDGAPSRDFEDIAYHDGALYLADTGDNGARDGSVPVHDDVALVRVREPELPAEIGATIHLSTYERLVLRYPDRPRDCEAVFVDPASGDVYLLTKENDGPLDVMIARAPLSTSETTTLAWALRMPGGAGLAAAVTAADISEDGSAIAVRTYLRAYLYPRAEGETIVAALERVPTELPIIREWQGESLGFSVDARTLYAIPEGADAPIHALSATCAPSP